MTLTLARISHPIGMSTLTVRDRCHDRIEVRVHGELVDSGDAKREDVQEVFRDVAIRSCNAFLNHCRVVARTPFVAGVERHYRIEDGQFYVLTPHTVTWFNGEDGSFLPAYEGNVNGAASSGVVRSPESGSASMSLLQQSFQLGEQPSLPRSLIIDAEEHVRTLRLREAVIALGTACEVASNEYLTRSGRSADPQVRSILRSRASFAEKRFHLLPNLLSSRSLKSEDTPNFDLVEKTYRTRNNLAHEGKLFFEDAGTTVNVDQQISTRFIAACELSITWLESL